MLLYLIHASEVANIPVSSQGVSAPTSLEHLVFGIASNQDSWLEKKNYVKHWWKPQQMRGCVFVDSMPGNESSYNDNSSLPPVCISEDTSRFRYTYRHGLPSAIRVAHVVSETVALNHSGVRWFVFGDDDTIFFPENLVKTLSKYDHELWYYIGTNSEIYEQNRVFSFDMAFGGAGFAISYPLAKVLAKVFDSCLERYPHLYGSDSRVYTCLAELGVGLTREPGFHQVLICQLDAYIYRLLPGFPLILSIYLYLNCDQVDVRGDTFGLLAAHPLAPLVSFHHLDHIDPIFPNMTANQAIEHLFEAVKVDSERVLQQTVCYDRWFSWTISVSWGYAVQVFENHQFLPDVLRAHKTFRQWKKGSVLTELYTFNTRELHIDPCRRPTIFFMDSVSSGRDGIESSYRRDTSDNCNLHMASPKRLEEIKVFSHKLDLKIKQVIRFVVLRFRFGSLHSKL